MSRSKADSRELPTGKSQQVIVDDSVQHSSKSTTMWVGWNAQHRIDKKATEKIWYLPAINQSPISITFVRETMKKVQELTNVKSL